MSEKTANIITKIVVPALLAVALVAACFWGFSKEAMAEEYKTATENIYTHAFLEMADNLSNMSVALGKLRVVASPKQYVLMLDDIWRLSGSCISLMAEIPTSHVDTRELASFITRVGDYAHSLTKKAVSGVMLTAEDAKVIDELYAACTKLSNEYYERIQAGDIPTAVITADGYFAQSEAAGGGNADTNTGEAGDNDASSGEGTDGGNTDGGNTADDVEKEQESIDKFPTLIYDGPYSEANEKRTPRGLSGSDITEAEAKAIALAATGLSDIASQGSVEGDIPAYDFQGVYDDSRTVDVSVTKRGGRLRYLMSSATGNAEGVAGAAETAALREAGRAYLEQMGFSDMRPTYAEYYSGAAVINFAATQDGVILYSDLVKVWIDRATRKVIGFDSRNYLFSHTVRALPTPEVTAEEAESALSQGIAVSSRALSLIPLTGETEVLCHEFRGKCGNDEYIVYVNAVTGEEEQVLLIVNSENGQLTI